MRLLVLTADMSRYRGALYQQDVLQTLERHAEIVLYGPGFEGFNPQLRAQEVLARLPARPEAVVVAHSWLHDASGEPTTRSDALDPRDFDIPVIVMLNKEYARLETKLQWIVQQRPIAVLSHHHDVDRYSSLTGVRFFFWPFAVNTSRFLPSALKTTDIGFSGILQNPSFKSTQSDIRLRILRHLFNHIGPIRLHRRTEFRDLRMNWRTFTGMPVPDLINRILHGHHRLSEEEYSAALAHSRMWLNGPSPLNLVGTRYFECMAAKTLVLTPYFPELDRVFRSDELVTFNSEDDFVDKVRHYLTDANAAAAITERGYATVRRHHTWEHRIKALLSILQNSV